VLRFHTKKHCRRPLRRLFQSRLQLEPLESRNLPALSWPVTLQPVGNSGPHEVLDQALDLPVVWAPGSGGQPAEALAGVSGNIGGGPDGAADVDWYHFALDRAATVTLGTFSQMQGTVISLYNTDTPFSDPYDPLGHRLVAQQQAAAGGNQDQSPITRSLAAGDYYVAVSGAGNLYFHPFVAGSGYPGATGPYRLLFQATDLQISPVDLPAVLAIDPEAYSVGDRVYDRSPLLIRVDLSGPVDPSQVIASVSSTAPGSSNNFVSSVAFSSVANELSLYLTGPLLPGTYEVEIAAHDAGGAPILAADSSLVFTVAGIDGNTVPGTGGDNTPATARELNVASGNLVQVVGTIGTDPTSSIPFDANGVDVYHFQVTDARPYALTAEVFAGRIGSPLFPAVSLFERVGGQLHLVTLNVGTGNPEAASDVSPVPNPLQYDPALYAALTSGDYYLVVSALGNTPDPFGGDLPFDPNMSLAQSFSGFAFQGGAYVLNVQVEAELTPPQVTSVTGLPLGNSAGPPSEFVVQFSEGVNLQQLAFGAQQVTLDAVTIQGPGGQSYSPHLVSYDAGSNAATFILADRLPPGTYQLHLSGFDPLGAITDIAGNPLVGNDSSGDYVYAFTVGTPGNGTAYQETANDAQHPQNLGTLAAFDLADGITLTGQFASEGGDYYEFQVLENKQYLLTLQGLPAGNALPPGNWLTITNVTTGTTVPLLPQGAILDPASQVNTDGQISVLCFFQPGTNYVVRVQSWAAGAAYQLQFLDNSGNEAPPPLTVGAGPAIRIRFLNNGNDPPPPPVLPPVIPPPPTSPPAGLPGNSRHLTPGSGDGSSATTVPASVLLTLAAGPVGSLNGAAPGSDVFSDVFARAPIPFFSDGILRLAILSLHYDPDLGDDEFSPPTGQQPLSLENQDVWQGVMYSLRSVWQSLQAPPTDNPAVALGANAPAIGSADRDDEDEDIDP
jgi:hypothetical protein